MTIDRHDAAARAFRASYAVIVDSAPLVDDDVARVAAARRRRPGWWKAVAAAAVVLLAVGAAAWLAAGGREPDLVAVGTAPFEPDVVVYLHTQVTADELALVRAAVEGHAEVGRVAFFSQADAYEEAQVLFADDPELLALITPELLPPSIRFEAPRDAWPTLVEELAAMDGVVKMMTSDDLERIREGP